MLSLFGFLFGCDPGLPVHRLKLHAGFRQHILLLGGAWLVREGQAQHAARQQRLQMSPYKVRAMVEARVGHQFRHRTRHVGKPGELPLHVGQAIK